MPEEKEDPTFKVVDRRSFETDGSRRDSQETAAEKPVTATATPSAATAPSKPQPSARPAAPPPSDFQTLVSYLATTAMFQLGLLPGPSGESIPLDLASARRTLDLLDVLEQKTQGNLTKEEAKLLDDVLYELRVTYIEIQKGGAAKAK